MRESRTSDTNFMRAALRLAARARGRTSPNPMVGAVVVRNGRTVGTGYHRKAGQAHAEVLALEAAGAEARGACLYVTFEPCCHHGRTPPCVEAIVRAGIERVVAAIEDPDPRCSGRGLGFLRRSGVEVSVGCLAEEAARLNEVYLKSVRTGLPWVTLKLALSLDGKTAARPGERLELTGEKARRRVHHLRAVHDAVMVGSGTVLADDPLLTVRYGGWGQHPLRVVLDTRGRTPPDSRLLAGGLAPGTRLYTGRTCPEQARDALASLGAQVVALPETESGRLDLRACLGDLSSLGVRSVLVEGGATLAGGLLRERLVDSVSFFYAPVLIAGDAPGAVAGGFPGEFPGVRITETRFARVGVDLMVTGYVSYSRTGETDKGGELVGTG